VVRIGSGLAFAAAVACLAEARAHMSASEGGQQERPPVLRAAVDVIPVDVQVIDSQGQPVAGLGPEKFTVTINRRRHRVLSAEFVRTRGGEGSPATPLATNTLAARTPRGGSQVIILAIDGISFSPATVRSGIEAARDFLKALPPDDLVGLVAYPVGPDIAPTVDRAVIARALDAVVGQRDTETSSQFRLRSSEIVDLATEMPREDGPILTALARQKCGVPLDLACVKRLSVEATTAALYYEAQANVSIAAVRDLLQRMALVPGRKTLVLLSSGVIASDRPGGRPDVRELASVAGREAVRANTTIYALHIDTELLEKHGAETGSLDANLTNIGRDRQIRALWLEQFSGAAGGALFRVLGGSGEYAFRRIVTETSSYYLLAVEASGADWNGVPQEIKVKVDARHSTVRSRRWVTMPRKDAVRPAVPPAGSPSTPESAPSPEAPRPRAPLPSELQPLAETFERGEDTRLEAELRGAQDLANLIRAFRAADPPWPETPKLAAVFALELAVAGLRSDNGFARDQGARLLAEYTTRVRQPLGADAFECTWLWAQAAALGGLLRPNLAAGFVGRALTRCPNESRLHLADAIIAEQTWLSSGQPGAAETAAVMQRYTAAMKFAETALEARVRGASFLLMAGDAERALALLDGPADKADDTYVTYLAELTRSRALRALGRMDDAIAALRAALIAWPGAQSAQVALMTLLFNRGARAEAAALAEAIQAAGDDQFDPWWTYTFGDFRAYPTIVGRLRELAR
jgi:VWFA-related protein